MRHGQEEGANVARQVKHHYKSCTEGEQAREITKIKGRLEVEGKVVAIAGR